MQRRGVAAATPARASSRKGPLRTCIGCRTQRTPAELVRVTCDENGSEVAPRIGVHGSGGRGAWLCRDVACVAAAGERRAFSRAFRRKLADPHFADTLLGWLAEQDQSQFP